MGETGFHPLKVADWPTQDREAWLAAQVGAPRGSLARGPAIRWSKATWQITGEGYGHWLGWLAKVGCLDRASGPDRVTVGFLERYVEDMKAGGLADQTCAGRIQAIRDALRVIAPEYDSQWVSLGATRIRAQAIPKRDPTAKMRPGSDLFRLGVHLMSAAESNGIPWPKRPICFRDGLLIAFLICCPIRLRSLASMKLENVAARGDEWRLSLPGEAVKSSRVFECPWPPMLVQPLERYLNVYRPMLASSAPEARTCGAFWLSSRAIPLDESGLGQVIDVRTAKAFGHNINPHLFRHIAATDIATHAPKNISDAAAVLGHASLDVTEKYYIHAQSMNAVRAFQELVLNLMKGTPQD